MRMKKKWISIIFYKYYLFMIIRFYYNVLCHKFLFDSSRSGNGTVIATYKKTGKGKAYSDKTNKFQIWLFTQISGNCYCQQTPLTEMRPNCDLFSNKI